MKLRGRFTLTLVLAALVPIAVAAIVTTRVLATSYRDEYFATRRSAVDAMHRELDRMRSGLKQAGTSLASHENPFINGVLHEVGSPTPDIKRLRQLRENSGSMMRVLGLDILEITGPGPAGDDTVIIAPHDRAAINAEPAPEVRRRATATNGEPYFIREKVMSSSSIETILAIEVAQLGRDPDYTFTLAFIAGRRIGDDLLHAVRWPGRFEVDARIVGPAGEVLLPPGPAWERATKDPPSRIDLVGPDGKPVATVEIAVSDGGLDHLLWNLTLTSAALGLGALGGVVALGLFAARRTARDLERLVEGSLAAARGDFDHRVPVRSKDEVGAVASAFNFMMEDLKTSKDKLVIAERIAAWQDMARRLAHEIKNPLTPIQMAMDTLRKSYKKQHPEFGEILDESTKTVLEEADRLKKIVAEFSDFARMPKPEFARVDLNEIVKSSLTLYQGAVPVATKLGELPQLDADKGQITQVMLNLVENAREALRDRDRGRISVATRLGEAGDRALLVVEDNGPGVPPELKDKVFAPYFTTKQAKGGTGLGLAIVHRIVSDHGGRITISDAPGGGARFAIELPLRNGTALLASRI
jgi:signal transduction histidine kinase